MLYKVILLAFLGFIFTGKHVFAQTTTNLQVVTEFWYPFNYKNAQGEIIGSATQSVKQILAKAQVNYEISMYDWSFAYNLARSQANVIIYSILRTPAREHLFHWVCPVASEVKNSVYKLATRKDIRVASINDLVNYSINVTRGTFPHQYFVEQGMEVGKNLQLTSNNQANILMLFKQRVDLIVEAELAIASIVSDAGHSIDEIEKVFTLDPINPRQTCMAISKQTDIKLVQKIQQAHQALIDEGLISVEE